MMKVLSIGFQKGGGEIPDYFKNFGGYLDRIRGTFQPPLYNVLMFFWLKIFDTEFLFRFFGVFVGAIGMIFLYKTFRLITKNKYAPFIAIVFVSFLNKQVYYYQEAAEYCLLMPTMYFSIYSFIKYIQNINLKNLIQMSISFVLPLYSQYGAFFPIFVMSITALIITCKSKNINNIKNIIISYITCIIAFGLPLFYFFFRYNINNNQNFKPFTFYKGIIFDVCYSMFSVFRFNFSHGAIITDMIILVIIFFIFIYLFFYGKSFTKLLIKMNICIFFIYYFFTKAGFYANSPWVNTNDPNRWYNRWSLFFVPILIVLAFTMLYDLYIKLSKLEIKKFNLRKALYPIIIVFIIISCCSQYFIFLRHNWLKVDVRSATQYYFNDSNGGNDKIIVCHQAIPSFLFYMTKNGIKINELNNDDKFIYFGRSINSIEEIFNEKILDNDDNIYLMPSLTSADPFIEYFNKNGYQEEIINFYGQDLIKFYKKII